MTQQNINTINVQIEAFPALPAIVTQVLSITSDPESSANNLMEAILPDQSMCAAILKVANSAFYGLPREISTIEQAVVILGQEEIKNIVLGKAIFASFPKVKKEHRNQIGLFWEHAYTCALAARVMAPQFNLTASELFIAGLIHDIGKIAMLMAFPNNYPLLHDLNNPSYSSGIDKETSDYGISHDQVGLKLAEQWFLPEQLIMAIGYHHNPQEAPSHNKFPLIVQAADSLSLVYDSLEISAGQDVEKIFNDFLPETVEIWQKCECTWPKDNIGSWFEKLRQHREEEQSIFEMFSTA